VDYSSNTRTIRVFRLKVPFNETQATWNIRAAGSNWQTAGASGTNDRESADIGSAQILSNEPFNTEKQIALTPAMIEELVEGTFTNNGFLLVADTELNDGFTYKSSDHATSSQRPKLVIQYTVPSGGLSPREGASRFLSNNSKPLQQSGFPSTSVLDNFNRANGAIGGNWSGQNDSSFAVSANQLAVTSSGLDSFAAWSPASFGADQEAYLTLSQISASGLEQGLLLKTASDASAAIKVIYMASSNAVRVFTYTPATGWVQRGADISVTFNNGDQFGARAKANGDVEVYKNGSLLGTVSVTAWAPYSGGGYIGLWYSNASGAIVDDFGGGNVSSNPTATPTNILTPTTTNTPTITPTASNTPTITNTATITDTPTLSLTPSDTPIPSDTPTVTFTPTQTFTPSFTPTLTNIPTFTSTPGQPPTGPVTIIYEYDDLYRLTEANYSNGDYYHYTYDAVGNRLSQTTQFAVISYQYDLANRLKFVDSVEYFWDNNGNLLNDGVNTYAYDSANRLTSFNGTSSYAYNGLGDRLSQTVNGNTTNYTLDLNAGLTQVLNDGTNTYLYGLGRIAQVNTTTEYFLGDALGSVRQLTDASGEVTLANVYEPYGVLAQTAGSAQTSYGFTGESTDPSGMVYLRARYYSPSDGRFLTRDTWMGEFNRPLSLNRWNYVHSNPIMFTDPSGHIDLSEAQEAFEIVAELKSKYQVSIIPDWGNFEKDTNRPIGLLPVTPAFLELAGYGCGLWHPGTWSLEELRIVKAAVINLDNAMKHLFTNYIKAVTIQKVWYTCGRGCTKSGNLIQLLNSNRLPPKSSSNNFLTTYTKKSQSEINFDQWTVVHELGHVWDQNNNWNLSVRLEDATDGDTMSHSPSDTNNCTIYDPYHELPGCNTAGYWYGGIPPVTSSIGFNRREDFAESVAAYVFPNEAWHEMQKQLEFYKANARDVYSLYYAHLYYGEFRNTERGVFIESEIGK